MLKHITGVLLACSVCLFSNAQNGENHNLDFVILVDSHITLSPIQKPMFVTHNSKNEVHEIPISYYPGNLTMKESEWQYLTNHPSDTISFDFEYVEKCGENKHVHTYQIDLGRDWLKTAINKGFYTVINIINTGRKHHKNMFRPLPGKTYTYEVYTPDYKILRRKKGHKKDCI